jgi:hypothetical protein
VVVSWIDIGSGSSAKIGVSMSDTGGQTFHTPFGLPTSTTGDPNTDQSDPVVAADLLGNFFITWLGFDRGSQGRPTNMNLYLARSTNGGTSFDDLVKVAPSEWVSGSVMDKPWLASSPMDGTLYATWSRAVGNNSPDIRLSRSTDHGVTWSAPVTISETQARPSVARNLAQIVVGTDGKAYVTWVEIAGNSEFGSPSNKIYLQRLNADGTANGGNVLVSGGSDSPTFEDPSVAVSGSNVYVGYVSGTSMGDWDVRVAASLDGGATFQPSVKANDDATCATHFHHQVATDASGNVWVTWIDNRYLKGNLFVSSSAPAQTGTPLSFAHNGFVNDTSFDFTTSRQSQAWLGDYVGFTVVGTQGYITWTDPRFMMESRIFFAKGQLAP